MKKFYTILFILGCVVASTTLVSFSSEAPIGKTGAPGEGLCTDCHFTNPPNSGSGGISINFDGKPGYLSNNTYKVLVRIDHEGADVYGFSMLALDSNLQSAGSFKVLEPSKTTLVQTGGLEYMGHKDAKYIDNMNEDYTIYEMEWTAPDTTTGDLTFYFVGRALDKDNILVEDYVYSDSLVVVPGYFTQVEKVEAEPFKVFPNPLSKGNKLNIQGSPSQDQITVYSSSGSLIYQGVFSEFNSSGLIAGIYLIQSERFLQKLVVL